MELVTTKELSPGVTVVTLNDPSTRNAMSSAMGERFNSTIQKLKSDKKLRVVVLTGAGEAFSGGGHLDMLFEKTKLTEKDNQAGMELFYDQFLSIQELGVPTIAAINGHAVGAGLCLSLACDMRIAKQGAKLGLNFVHLGLHPGMGVTYYLPRLVGPAKAAELLYLGKIIPAEEGAAIGLVNRCVLPGEFEQAISEAASGIAQAGPQAVFELKESLRNSPNRSLKECLVREAQCQARDYMGSEFKEGIAAAKEKRKPKF